ncbi:Sporulation domain protein [Methylophaga frappieri]|uniref:Sporulation domain protein n=2 Tax=Methylophaga frappieri (strain ATCC BAA-2434 / DSM 25690 / JAM7) TaxID=754477 RepID=I1YJL3_METFJ|nr:Sporulation domain protein [Methylophaga frappieri]
MLLSFTVGAFVMFLLHIKDNAPTETVASENQAETNSSGGIEPTFDFYTLLPESEEVVTRPQQPQQAIVTMPPQSEASVTETAVEAESSSQPVPASESYMIQVGSFKKLSDADGFKAKLAFLGIESRVQTVTIDDKDTWHRVQVGPINGRDRADEVQKQLRNNNIDSLLLRARHG